MYPSGDTNSKTSRSFSVSNFDFFGCWQALVFSQYYRFRIFNLLLFVDRGLCVCISFESCCFVCLRFLLRIDLNTFQTFLQRRWGDFLILVFWALARANSTFETPNFQSMYNRFVRIRWRSIPICIAAVLLVYVEKNRIASYKGQPEFADLKRFIPPSSWRFRVLAAASRTDAISKEEYRDDGDERSLNVQYSSAGGLWFSSYNTLIFGSLNQMDALKRVFFSRKRFSSKLTG